MKFISTLIVAVLFLQGFVSPAWSGEIYRMDNEPYSHESKSQGGEKSYIDQKTGTLFPADILGHITLIDHIARSQIRTLKDHSEFTSFSSQDLGDYYGNGYKIILDESKLEADIRSHKILGTHVYSTEKIQQQFNQELEQTLRLSHQPSLLVKNFKQEWASILKEYDKKVRIEHRPAKECDQFFWSRVDALPNRYPQLFRSLSKEQYVNFTYTVNGLRHVSTDREVLVEGAIPKIYFRVEKNLPPSANPSSITPALAPSAVH